MRYTVEELINDKELRKEVADGGFGFADRDGEFSAVDFENGSMRQNHISVFEELYAIGGDELFEKLIAQGNTCLTKDPNAAKVGVIPVNGADGYYLKTNASFAAAFASILSGLAGLEDDDRFSFGTDEEDDPNTFLAYEEFSYINSSFVDELCTIEKADDGSYVVVNPDTEEIISFFIKTEENELRIDKFYEIKKLEYLDFCIEEENDNFVAYKYKLDEYGPWGYFNGNVSQITPPMFEDVILTYHDGKYHIIAYEKYGFQYKVYTDLYEREFGFDDPSEINTSRFFFVNADRCPGIDSYVDRFVDAEGNGVILYSPNPAKCEGLVLLNGNGVSFDDYKYPYGKEPSAVKITGPELFLFGADTSAKIPVTDRKLCAKDCYNLYFGKNPEYEFGRQLSWGTNYIVHKDGYYAVASYKSTNNRDGVGMEFDYLLTPFAFTDIKKTSNDRYVIVERFGKKGVFSLESKAYVIPCDYDRIEHNINIFDENEETFTRTFDVEKGGFVGKVVVKDEGFVWKKKLHRED
ncbi:MAG: hypothetical protein IKB50_00500 [Clostridia bacterium]|nr:hypothetical protein [Clostridia bacterium]